MNSYTPHQSKYFAEQILLQRPQSSIDGLVSAMSGVKVDLNPHQVDAALFAVKSPLSTGALLADEVGLGKTIEAGLVLAQCWAERRRHILLRHDAVSDGGYAGQPRQRSGRFREPADLRTGF